MREQGSTWPLLLPLLGVLLMVGAEIATLVWVAAELGWWTLALLAGSALLGLALIRWQWSRVWGALVEAARTGHLPPGKLADASLILIGGLLLLIPGVISDVFALLLLIPFTRQFVRSAFSWFAGRTLRRAGQSGAVVIEGEVITGTTGPADDTLIPGVIEGTVVDSRDDD
ncbi:FxsA family protein [Tessaracoccus palaemonis]|uniref:FxsA family protein n=1 Tax=Tessaracoccus palaemonis TaxID=2829499 RepID=A0ABX8SKA7_9ACTN|nr:FxsA family protein [Tessaracoccus palaemonis]QXT61649.1 FxsA family protein [Tessaracoccus palaemonis]